MGDFITIATVRRTCGITVNQISDDDIEANIAEVENQVARYYNTKFVPTEVIEQHDGDSTNRLFLDHNPILSVRALKIDGTSQDLTALEIYKESGYIFLGESSTTYQFSTKRNSNVVKYLHGTLRHSSTSSTTTADEAVGTSVTVTVASSTGFAIGDWVEIYGMDGNREVAQISSISSNDLILDQLVLTHESGSTVVKLEIDPIFTKLMNIMAGIAAIATQVGASADDITGYTLAEFQVQKGEPYTQWREAATQLLRERDEIMSRINLRSYIAI